jgi:phospholipid/cholesterol/gamma-HCH transport system substrate-binding protein
VTDYETIQRKRNVIVGIFVVVAVCALIWLIFKFGDLPTTVSKINSFEVFIQFPTAPGVQKDTPVRFCGFQIGRVTKVMFPEERVDLNTQQKYHQTLVVLSIDKRYTNIPSNVEVKLMMRGLGSSYIELTVDPNKLPAPPRDPNRPETRFLVHGMPLQGSTGQASEFFPPDIQKKLDELLTNLDGLIKHTDAIIGDPNNKAKIDKMIDNVYVASEDVKQALQDANETMQEVRGAIKEFSNFSIAGKAIFEKADANLVPAVAELTEGLSEATSQLRQILEKINSGQGSAGRLIYDGKFYENLLENTQQVQMLLEELKALVIEAREKGIPLRLKK